MLVQIIISVTPILAYSIIVLWTNRLINSKLTNKSDRKKYKRVFNKRMREAFSPIFLASVLLVAILFPKHDKWIVFGIIVLSLKIVLLILQGVFSTMLLREIKYNIRRLRTDTAENILKDIKGD